MRIVLVADTFPPLRTSGAVQLRDLAREFAAQGHELTVLLPCSEINDAWKVEDFNGVRVVRLKAPRVKDIGYIKRTFGEFFMPFSMLRNLRKSPLKFERWDGVVWYAPSIFHGPLVKALKKVSDCKGYLIIRDIFPEWAVDMGLMKKGVAYFFFDLIAKYQYSIADIIGVQTSGNLGYFDSWKKNPGKKVEILQNWLFDTQSTTCSISIDQTALRGRRIFVYAGNMGVAQGTGVLLDLAEKLSYRKDIGFLFVGRGSDFSLLRSSAENKMLDNVIFHDEIHPDEIPALYAQCDVGMVALDLRHKSHNIPGKFLTYMQSGVPVLASINPGNDLADIIRGEKVGRVCECGDVTVLESFALELIDCKEAKEEVSARCRQLYMRLFSPDKAVRKIVSALT